MERMQKIGQVPYKSAKEIAFSRIGIGFEKLDRNVFEPEKAYGPVSEIGVKKVRIQSGWARTEKEEGVYDFAWLDEIVDRLLSIGMEPWMTLCYGNPVYTELAVPVFGAVGCPPIKTERERNAWLRYVRETAKHFRGRVSIYEVWNEPDAKYSWRHEENEEPDFHRNALEYGQFAIDTSKAVKEADPEAKTMALAMGSVSDLTYLNTALSTGLADYIDYASYHLYTVRYDRIERALNFAKLVHSYNANVKIVQGESGGQSRSDGAGALKQYAWTEERQMTQLLRIVLSDLYAGVEFTSYFSTMDMIEALRGRLADKASYLDYGYFGVVSAEFDEDGRATGTYAKKPSYYALSTLASLFAGDVRQSDFIFQRQCLPSRRVVLNDCDDSTVKSLPFKLSDGTDALVYWNDTFLMTGTYDGTASYAFYRMGNVTPELVDLRNGSIYAMPDTMKEDIPENGILLKNLPIHEFPLAIVFRKN